MRTQRAGTRPFPDKDPDLTCRLAMDRLQSQQQQIAALDGKIGNLLGFGGALLAILVVFLALRSNPIPGNALALLCISGAAYLGMAVGSLYAYYTRPWEIGPKLHEAWQYAREYDEKELGWWAAESLTKSYENNQNKVKRKVWVVNVNVALIVFQTITLGLGLSFIALS